LTHEQFLQLTYSNVVSAMIDKHMVYHQLIAFLYDWFNLKYKSNFFFQFNLSFQSTRQSIK